jgi:nucleotide-binding universal stress UspA family protein
MIKDITLNLGVDADNDPALDYAVSIAEQFDAHVTGIAFAYERVIPGSVMGSMAVEIIEADRVASRQAAQKATARFEAATKRSSLSAETLTISATTSEAMKYFAGAVRRSDLAVIGQPRPEESVSQELVTEAALFQSGRPVIVVPYINKGGLKLERVLCCWDGSATAARAIGDALPFLKRAKSIELAIVETSKVKPDQLSGADMGKHLARHGLKVTVKQLSSANVEVADVILSHASDNGIDLIVMGGYGHSRLREFVLGGTTLGILNTMTVPVLMSH